MLLRRQALLSLTLFSSFSLHAESSYTRADLEKARSLASVATWATILAELTQKTSSITDRLITYLLGA